MLLSRISFEAAERILQSHDRAQSTYNMICCLLDYQNSAGGLITSKCQIIKYLYQIVS
jgi:hypothetical protein